MLIPLQIIPILAVCGFTSGYQTYHTLKRQRLQHVIQTSNATTELECCRACNAHDTCVAVNFARASNTCELNSRHPLEDGTAGFEKIVSTTFNVLYLHMVCQRPWIVFKGHCYVCITAKMNWTESESHCNILGGHLVDIHTAEENEIVYKTARQVTTSDVWIGISGLWSGPPLQWSTDKMVNFTFYLPNQPNDWEGNEDCVEMKISQNINKWNDEPCWRKQSSICKKAFRVEESIVDG